MDEGTIRPHIVFSPAGRGPGDPSLRAAQSSIGASPKKGGRILRMPLAFSLTAVVTAAESPFDSPDRSAGRVRLLVTSERVKAFDGFARKLSMKLDLKGGEGPTNIEVVDYHYRRFLCRVMQFTRAGT
jgi:hypothetical protein